MVNDVDKCRWVKVNDGGGVVGACLVVVVIVVVGCCCCCLLLAMRINDVEMMNVGWWQAMAAGQGCLVLAMASGGRRWRVKRAGG